MITEVKKYLILGTEEDLDLFYKRAQQEGFIEFISSSRRSKEVPEKIQFLLKAIKILKKASSSQGLRRRVGSRRDFETGRKNDPP